MSPDQSFTVAEFCAAERISRGGLYKLWARGEGPVSYHIGKSRRISAEARQEWRHQLELEAVLKRKVEVDHVPSAA
jgi:hypothetical protein